MATCVTALAIWGVVYVAGAGVMACAAALYFFPRRWLAANPAGPEVIPRGAPLPWRFVNSRGRAVWIGLYASGAALVLSLAAGAWLFG